MELKFIIDKLTSWPVLGFFSLLILVISFYKPLRNVLNKTDHLKIGSFEFNINRIGESLGVSNTIGEINDLTYEELKIFMIMCGEDADYYVFSPKNIPPEKFERMYMSFSNKGLLELVDIKDMKGYEELTKQHGKANFGFKTTEKGRLIHKILLETIFHELTETKIKK